MSRILFGFSTPSDEPKEVLFILPKILTILSTHLL